MYTASIAFAWSLGNKIVSEFSSGYILVERNFDASVYHCYIMNKGLQTIFAQYHLSLQECSDFARQQGADFNEACWNPLFRTEHFL